MTSRFAGVLFDKDGVFVDFEKTWTPVMRTIAEDFSNGDMTLTAQLLNLAGFDPHSDVFLPGSVWAAGHTDDLVKVWLPVLDGLGEQAAVRRINEHCLRAKAHPLLPLKEQRDILGSLQASGLRLGVATNDSTASARATVSAFGLSQFFDVVLGYDAVVNPKPAGDPLVEFARHTGLQPDVIIMVGDNRHDMECGRAAGAGLCVGVLSGNSTMADLAPLADHVVEDISALGGLFSRLAAAS